MAEVTRVAFLASGGGGTMRALHHGVRHLDLPFRLVGVVADRECGAIAGARAWGLPTEVVQYSRDEPESLRRSLERLGPDCIVTNIHKVLDAATLDRYPGRFINVHYSVLPAFAGLIGMATVDAARAENARVVGGTCHVVTDELDGGPILGQASTAVDWSTDHLEVIKDTVFRLSSLAFLNSLIEMFGEPQPGRTTQHLWGRDTVFSPALDSRLATLDEHYWSLVASASA